MNTVEIAIFLFAALMASAGSLVVVSCLIRDAYKSGHKDGYRKASYDAALIQTTIHLKNETHP